MDLMDKYICEKLDEAEEKIKSGNAVWFSFDDVAKEKREKLIEKSNKR